MGAGLLGQERSFSSAWNSSCTFAKFFERTPLQIYTSCSRHFLKTFFEIVPDVSDWVESLGRSQKGVWTLSLARRYELCAAAWNDVDPIIVSYVVTGGVGCDVARLLSGSNESTGFLLSQKFVWRECRYRGNNLGH